MKLIHNTMAALEVGPATTFGKLTLFPLLSPESRVPDYLTLEEALEQGCSEVTEVSPAGTVSELLFTNHGDRSVLLLDGEALVGAKQDRVLNLSILAPARKTIRIPVSCVEAGRWSARSQAFKTATNMPIMPPDVQSGMPMSASPSSILDCAIRTRAPSGRTWPTLAPGLEQLPRQAPWERCMRGMTLLWRNMSTPLLPLTPK